MLARVFVALLIAVFGVSGAAHAAATSAMSVEMSLSDHGAMDMAGCEGCGDGGGSDEMGGATCSILCAAPFAATLGAEKALPRTPAVGAAAPPAACGLVGRTGPPDPSPPRSCS